MEGGTSSMGSELNTALQSNVTPSKLISEFTSIMPWIAAMVAAAFVIYEAKKMIKGASKAKVRL